MTRDELRDLLKKRVDQAAEALALMKARPHHNRMFTETLRMAAQELKEAAGFWLDNFGEFGGDEEGIKAHLAPRYDEFLRCRSRVTADFAEMDEAKYVVYGFRWMESVRGGGASLLYCVAFDTHSRAQDALSNAYRHAPVIVGDDQEREYGTNVLELKVNAADYDLIRDGGAKGRRIEIDNDRIKKVLS